MTKLCSCLYFFVIFYYLDPQKALPYAETRVLSPYSSLPVLLCDLVARRRVQKRKVRQKSLSSQTPSPSPHVNQILHGGRIPDIFLGFEFQKDRLENVRAVRGVEILAFSLTRHIAYTTACCYRYIEAIRDLKLCREWCYHLADFIQLQCPDG